VEAPGQLPSLPPPLNAALRRLTTIIISEYRLVQTSTSQLSMLVVLLVPSDSQALICSPLHVVSLHLVLAVLALQRLKSGIHSLQNVYQS